MTFQAACAADARRVHVGSDCHQRITAGCADGPGAEHQNLVGLLSDLRTFLIKLQSTSSSPSTPLLVYFNPTECPDAQTWPAE